MQPTAIVKRTQMPTYTLPELERHWEAARRGFASELPSAQAFFEQLPRTASSLANALAGRRSLTPNCSYLLLTKSLNHALATYLLLQRGLMIDAALTARNALETLLLLELLSLRPELCESWTQGKEFRPGEVRRLLASVSNLTVGDLVITVSEDEYADAGLAYSWLSQITHANLESLNHAVSQVDQNSFVLHVGGARLPAQSIAISKILGVTFLRSLVTCAAVHSPQLLQSDRARFLKLKRIVSAISAGRNGA